MKHRITASNRYGIGFLKVTPWHWTVFDGKDQIGDIKEVKDGWQYTPTGGNGGKILPTLEEVKSQCKNMPSKTEGLRPKK